MPNPEAGALSVQRFSRRQLVDGIWYSAGRSRHRAPVFSTLLYGPCRARARDRAENAVHRGVGLDAEGNKVNCGTLFRRTGSLICARTYALPHGCVGSHLSARSNSLVVDSLLRQPRAVVIYCCAVPFTTSANGSSSADTSCIVAENVQCS